MARPQTKATTIANLVHALQKSENSLNAACEERDDAQRDQWRLLAMLRRAHTVLNGATSHHCRRPGDFLSEMESLLAEFPQPNLQPESTL